MFVKITISTGLKKDPLNERLPEFKKMMAADTYFTPRVLTSTDELKDVVKTYNYSFIAWNQNYRNATNFAEATGIMLDIDSGLTMAKAQEALKSLDCYALLISTQSHMKPKANKSGVIETGERFRIIIPTSRKFHTFSDLKNALDPFQRILSNSVDLAAFLASQFFIPSPNDAVILETSSTNLYDPNKLLRLGVYASKDPGKPGHRNVQDAWFVDRIGGILDREKRQIDELPKEKLIIYCPFCDDINSDSASAWIEAPTSGDKTRVIHCSHCDASYFSKTPIPTDADFIEQVAYSAASIGDEPEPAQWIVQDVLAQSECFSIFGEAGSGKSYAILQLAISVASGIIKEWLGYPIVRYGPVLYILNDGSHRSLKNRIRRISGYLKTPKPATLYILNNQSVFKVWQKDVERFIQLVKPILIVIDSLSMSVDSGDENSASDQKQYSNLLKQWCLDYNLNVAVVHHVTKSSSDRQMNQNNFRGSNHWIGVLASMLEFRKNYKKELHNIYKLVKSRDGDPKATNVREVRYEEIGSSQTSAGVYDLTEKQVISGYKFVGSARDDKAPGEQQDKIIPYVRDVFLPGQTKSYRQSLDDIMMKYHRQRRTAGNILAEWLKEGLLIRSKTGDEVFYTSTEEPTKPV